MIHRYVEKALNLLGVQIHRQNAVGPGSHQQIGHELGRDRHARLILPILSGVAVKWQHRCDAVGAGPFERVHNDEQLHQVMICWRAGRLNHKHILTSDVFLDLGKRFSVGEGGEGDFARLDANVTADGIGEREIRTAGEYFHVRFRSGRGFNLCCRATLLAAAKSNNWQTPIKCIRALGNKFILTEYAPLGQALKLGEEP